MLVSHCSWSREGFVRPSLAVGLEEEIGDGSSQLVAPPIRSGSHPGGPDTRAGRMRYDDHIAEHWSQPAAGRQPAGDQCRTIGGGGLRGHAHRGVGRPVLQRQRLDHPDGSGRRRPLVRQDLRPPDDVRGPRPGQAGRRLRRQLRRLRRAHRRPRRVVGDLRRQADLDLQPAPGRDLARRRAVHGRTTSSSRSSSATTRRTR